ncbi:hypothetical protein IJO12_09240 [bacterium]|nr:hypothetical protein [bacterium]
MKITFKSIKTSVKNLPWQKIGKTTKSVIKYSAIAGFLFMTAKSCDDQYEKYDKRRTEQQEEIKAKDINRYNNLIEKIALGDAVGDFTFWTNEYTKMNDSIRIAQRAYFEGAQMVRDSINNAK